MYKIEIYFVGGTSSTFTGVPKEVTEKFVEWLDNKENLETFKIGFPNHNKTSCVRKEQIGRAHV